MTRDRLCFACDRKLGRNPALIRTADGQSAFVGSDCLKHIVKAGADGWQPPAGGPRLYRLAGNATQQEIADNRARAVNRLPSPTI